MGKDVKLCMTSTCPRNKKCHCDLFSDICLTDCPEYVNPKKGIHVIAQVDFGTFELTEHIRKPKPEEYYMVPGSTHVFKASSKEMYQFDVYNSISRILSKVTKEVKEQLTKEPAVSDTAEYPVYVDVFGELRINIPHLDLDNEEGSPESTCVDGQGRYLVGYKYSGYTTIFPNDTMFEDKGSLYPYGNMKDLCIADSAVFTKL